MKETSEYQTKLRDPRWQRRRLEKMQEADWQCEICGDDKSELHVHHREYWPDFEPWDYPLEQLRCLCRDCHTLSHMPQDKIKTYAESIALLPLVETLQNSVFDVYELMDKEQYWAADAEREPVISRQIRDDVFRIWIDLKQIKSAV